MSAPSKGFTLIELIVTVSIILLMTGGGISVFSLFRSKKAAINDAQVVANTLRDAHRRSMAGVKPEACNGFGLESYTVSVNSDSLQLVAKCPGGTPDSETVKVNNSSLNPTPAQYVFPNLTGGSTSGTIDVCSSNIKFRVTVTSAGSISDPVEVPGGC